MNEISTLPTYCLEKLQPRDWACWNHQGRAGWFCWEKCKSVFLVEGRTLSESPIYGSREDGERRDWGLKNEGVNTPTRERMRRRPGRQTGSLDCCIWLLWHWPGTRAKVDLKEMKESPVKCVREGMRYSGGGEEGGEGLLPTGQAGVGAKTRETGNSKGRRDEFEQLLWNVHFGKESCY